MLDGTTTLLSREQPSIFSSYSESAMYACPYPLTMFVFSSTGLQAHDYINVPVLLHTISSFPKEALARTSTMVLQGLRLCIDEPSPLRNEIMTSPDFWAIMRALTGRPDSAPLVFDILELGCGGTPPAIIADNYEAAISLFGDFASGAGRIVLAERKLDVQQRKAREGTHDKTT